MKITGVYRIDNNVRAGAKYRRFIIDRYYRYAPMTPLDKEVLAIASYNTGPARIAGLRPRRPQPGSIQAVVPECGCDRRSEVRPRDGGLREQHLQVLPRTGAVAAAS
jgi:hypothetical protein